MSLPVVSREKCVRVFSVKGTGTDRPVNAQATAFFVLSECGPAWVALMKGTRQVEIHVSRQQMDASEVWEIEIAKEYVFQFLLEAKPGPLGIDDQWAARDTINRAVMEAEYQSELTLERPEPNRHKFFVKKQDFLHWVHSNTRLAEHLAQDAPVYSLARDQYPLSETERLILEIIAKAPGITNPVHYKGRDNMWSIESALERMGQPKAHNTIKNACSRLHKLGLIENRRPGFFVTASGNEVARFFAKK